MNETDARTAVFAALHEVAPDVETDDLDASARLRQDLELDSLDFLSLVEQLHALTGVDIPEGDYGAVETVAGMSSYLVQHSA